MMEKYPGVMMPPPEEITPETKKAISEAIDHKLIEIDNLSPEARVAYFKHLNVDIDIAATYPTPEEMAEVDKLSPEQRVEYFQNKLGESREQLGRGMTNPESYIPDDPSLHVDKTSHLWGGILPGTYSGSRGGITEANARILAGSKPDVVVNSPSQDVRLGNNSGYAPDWKEYKSETPYVEKPLDVAELDRLQLERKRWNEVNSGAYASEAMNAYMAHRGPFDFSLEKELTDLAKDAHIDLPVLWNPDAQNGNGSIYGAALGNAQGHTMRRILPQLHGELKHPISAVVQDTEMSVSKDLSDVILGQAIIRDEIHHDDSKRRGMGRFYSDNSDPNAETVHLRFGNPYHNSDQYVKDLLDENVKNQDDGDSLTGMWVPGVGIHMRENNEVEPYPLGVVEFDSQKPAFNYVIDDTGVPPLELTVEGLDPRAKLLDELVDTDIEVSLADPNKPKPTVVVLGHTSPRYLGAQLYNAIKDAGIEATVVHSVDKINDGIAEPIRNTGSSSMKHLSPAALSLKHMQSMSPYASGRKKVRDDFMDERRLEMRQSQAKRNKAQGFGKRITKKDKVKTESESIKESNVSKQNFTVTGPDVEWKTTVTVKDGVVQDIKTHDIKHTLEGDYKEIE